jgi:hypothetical protein
LSSSVIKRRPLTPQAENVPPSSFGSHLRKIKLLILASFISNRELKREAAWSRIHLVPLILAEQDRDAYRRNEAALAREKEIMKDVPDWEVSRTEGLNRLI